MAVEQQSQISLVNTLIQALANSSSALHDSEEYFLPPADGISLLDARNDLLLSYLQNLVFLILFRLRNARAKQDTSEEFGKELKHKLIELKVFLDKGVRPLEAKLKYQIDSTLKAAEILNLTKQAEQIRKSNSNSVRATDLDSEPASNHDDLDMNEEDAALLYRPNLLQGPTTQIKNSKVSSEKSSQSTSNGVYKPPRLNPTAMPDPDRRDRNTEPRKRKSQLLNEYIDEEMSSAPRAQPSIGSSNTILENGRAGLSNRDREKERERTEYEERNFIRLPGQSKKEKREARRKGQFDSRDMFGGEDWTGLGGLGDRVSKSVTGGGRDSVLKRREKRRATEDMPRSDGMGIGDNFDKRRRILEGRAEKKTKRR